MIVVGFENDALILRALLPFFEKRIPGRLPPLPGRA
jgi:hypothetical protein